MNPRKLYQWVRKTSKTWTGSTRHAQKNIELFSRGVVLAESSHVRQIAGHVPGMADSQRRRLQRFLKRELPMDVFFAQWTRSVVGEMKRRQTLVMIVDETKLKDELGVMVVGVVYHGRCIPLAWAVYRANEAEEYPAEGQVDLILRLVGYIQAGLAPNTPVRLLADRGIGTSPRLMQGLMDRGWTFLFRVTKQSKVILPDGTECTFYDQVQAPGESYAAGGLVFKKRGRIPAHVRVLWGPSAQERWSLVTNDPTLTGWEYAERMWIEEAFRDLKSHGWHIEDALFDDPARMARLWILLVVAYTWMLFIGQAVETVGLSFAPQRRPDGARVRRWSLFQEGRRFLLSAAPPF
jgi:hypothetical protein